MSGRRLGKARVQSLKPVSISERPVLKSPPAGSKCSTSVSNIISDVNRHLLLASS